MNFAYASVSGQTKSCIRKKLWQVLANRDYSMFVLVCFAIGLGPRPQPMLLASRQVSYTLHGSNLIVFKEGAKAPFCPQVLRSYCRAGQVCSPDSKTLTGGSIDRWTWRACRWWLVRFELACGVGLSVKLVRYNNIMHSYIHPYIQTWHTDIHTYIYTYDLDR